jgi:cytidine deaminase
VSASNLSLPYQWIEDSASLAADEQALLDSALSACDKAYAPYSHFHVGCALGLEGGEVITGNNQENQAFPSGLCAERTALFYAGSQGKGGQLRKLAIRARSEKLSVNRPGTPCGGCRQVMLEYERMAGQDLVILMQGETGPVLRLEGVAKTLLPFAFDIEF